MPSARATSERAERADCAGPDQPRRHDRRHAAVVLDLHRLEPQRAEEELRRLPIGSQRAARDRMATRASAAPINGVTASMVGGESRGSGVQATPQAAIAAG